MFPKSDFKNFIPKIGKFLSRNLILRILECLSRKFQKYIFQNGFFRRQNGHFKNLWDCAIKFVRIQDVKAVRAQLSPESWAFLLISKGLSFYIKRFPLHP